MCNNEEIIKNETKTEPHAKIEKLDTLLAQLLQMDVQLSSQTEEGEGRAYGVGGTHCQHCPHCYGEKDWCPLLD